MGKRGIWDETGGRGKDERGEGRVGGFGGRWRLLVGEDGGSGRGGSKLEFFGENGGGRREQDGDWLWLLEGSGRGATAKTGAGVGSRV